MAHFLSFCGRFVVRLAGSEEGDDCVSVFEGTPAELAFKHRRTAQLFRSGWNPTGNYTAEEIAEAAATHDVIADEIEAKFGVDPSTTQPQAA